MILVCCVSTNVVSWEFIQGKSLRNGLSQGMAANSDLDFLEDVRSCPAQKQLKITPYAFGV